MKSRHSILVIISKQAHQVFQAITLYCGNRDFKYVDKNSNDFLVIVYIAST